jgi:hypothetical protein
MLSWQSSRFWPTQQEGEVDVPEVVFLGAAVVVVVVVVVEVK